MTTDRTAAPPRSTALPERPSGARPAAQPADAFAALLGAHEAVDARQEAPGRADRGRGYDARPDRPYGDGATRDGRAEGAAADRRAAAADRAADRRAAAADRRAAAGDRQAATADDRATAADRGAGRQAAATATDRADATAGAAGEGTGAAGQSPAALAAGQAAGGVVAIPGEVLTAGQFASALPAAAVAVTGAPVQTSADAAQPATAAPALATALAAAGTATAAGAGAAAAPAAAGAGVAAAGSTGTSAGAAAAAATGSAADADAGTGAAARAAGAGDGGLMTQQPAAATPGRDAPQDGSHGLDTPTSPASDASVQPAAGDASAQPPSATGRTAPADAPRAADAPAPQPAAPAAAPAVAAQPAAPATPATPGVQRTVPLHRAAQATATLLHVAVDKGISRARLNLKPVELGGIEVRLQSTPQGVAAQLVADSPEAARMLAQAGDDLRRQLEARDVTLLSLDVATSGDQRREAAAGGGADGFGPEGSRDDRASTGGRSTGEAASTGAEPAETTIVLPGGLLVDVLA